MSNLLNRKTAFTLIVIGILLGGLVGGVYLSQQQTQLKSKAAQQDFDCVLPTARTNTTIGEIVTVNVGGSVTNYPNSSMSKMLVYVKAPGQGFTEIGSVNCSGSTQACSGSVNWNTGSLNNGAGAYTIAERLINTNGGERNSDGNDQLCQANVTLNAPAASNPIPPAAPAPAEQPAQQCSPGTADYANCRSCGGDGKWIVDYGPYSTPPSATWCACAVEKSGQAFATEKGCSGGGTGGPTGQQCTPGTEDFANCRACGSDGKWRDDYGPYTTPPSNTWCACAIAKSGASFAAEKGCTRQAGVFDAAVCSGPTFSQGGVPVSSSLIAGQTYDVKITMTNRDPNNPNPPIWQKGQYFLGFPTTGDTGIGDFKTNKDTVGTNLSINSLWQINWPDPAKLRLPLGSNVGPGGSAEFSFGVTPQKAGTHTFYWSMVHENVGWFGGQCTQDISVMDGQGAAPGATASPSTACFVMSEDQAEVTGVTKCDDAKAIGKKIIYSYSTEPTKVAYTIKDTKPGIKTIFVRFISTTGEVKDTQRSITFSPAPTVSKIACTQSATGTGTIVQLTGADFGPHVQQGAGSVTVNGTPAQITIWDPEKNLIQATVPNRLEGNLNIDLKVDDGRTVTGGKCTIGVSTVQFAVTNQCSAPGTFDIDNVDAIIIQRVQGAKPLVQTKIKVSKGQTTFAPKLEANKEYSLILKGPRTLAKKVDFTADQGTVNLGNVQLLIGNIAPFNDPDSAINALDSSEMIRQWTLVSSSGASAKTASITKHETPGIVNSLDYSCLKLGIGKADDDLTLAAPAATTTTNRAIPVKGKVYLDANNDNTFDTGDSLLSGVSVKALYPTAVQTPGQTLTAAQAAAATVLGTATTDAGGNYSSTFIAPSNILNLVMWVGPGSTTGQGGQSAIGIGAFTDAVLQQSPATLDIAVKP